MDVDTMMFNIGDIVECYHEDEDEPCLIGIVRAPHILGEHVLFSAIALPGGRDWETIRAAWESHLVRLHPDPDTVWATYAAHILLEGANNEQA